MPEFRFTVTETRTVQVIYFVEAETMSDARAKALAGNTSQTEELSAPSVIRDITLEVDPALDD